MIKSDLYTTEKKEEIPVITKDQGVIAGYRVYATTKGGTKFHMDIPEDQLDKADALLAARAKLLDSI